MILPMSSSSHSPSFKAVIVKSVPLPLSGGLLKTLARSAPRPFDGGTMVRSAEGIDVSARGSGVRLLPMIPYRRRSISMISLKPLAIAETVVQCHLPQVLFETTRSKVSGCRVSRAAKKPSFRPIFIHRAVVPSVARSENITAFCQLLPSKSIQLERR